MHGGCAVPICLGTIQNTALDVASEVDVSVLFVKKKDSVQVKLQNVV